MAESFRVPNIDERVGMSPVLTVTNFNLRTQKSHDFEGGVRLHWDRVDVQSSVYDMYLTDELHFSPITFANVNLDPTRRYGMEHTATVRITDDVRLKGSRATPEPCSVPVRSLATTCLKFLAGAAAPAQVGISTASI